MPPYKLHNGPIAVHYHGGFLDGHVSRTGETPPGGFLEIWSARSFYFSTKGQVGAIMLGVSPDEWAAMPASSQATDRIPLNHLYRVTACRLENGTMNLDAAYEPAVK